MPDIEHSGVLILWGYNPSFTRLTHATAVVAGTQARHASNRRRPASCRPRTQGGSVAPGASRQPTVRWRFGLANVMIERGWYDRDFIREWS
jgi:anaerobic selenocysteine-containing dehydrogenase